MINDSEYYSNLKDKLVNNEFSFEDFSNELMELDQSTDDRIASINNLIILNDEKIIKYIQKQSEDTVKKYYQLLSFSEFHVGQISAIKESNQDKALGYFEKSLEHELKGYAFPANISYRKSTIAYLKNDLEGLDSSIDTHIEGNNLKILKNMANGLKVRGFSDYKEDYKI